MPSRMATKRDYYEVLGVSRDASPEEITKAYRKLVMQYHPDRTSGDKDAEVRFKEVAEAHEVLRDPEKRQRYDRDGHAGMQGVEMPSFGSFGDILREFFFGGGRGGSPQTGQDLEVDLELDLAEAARGGQRTLDIRRADICSKCKGSGCAEGSKRQTCRTCNGHGAVLQSGGFFNIRVRRECPTCHGEGTVITNPCKACRGNGLVVAEASVTVNVPAGVDSGQCLPVRGEGHAGGPGVARGDLLVVFHIRKHPLFERHRDDLVCQAFISFPQAALGCSIDIPTVDGQKLSHTLPRGIQSHEVVTIPGQGMPNLRTGRRGHLHVQVVIETPRQPTKRQEELLRELAEMEDRNVSPQRKSWLEKIKQFFTDAPKK